MKLCSFYFLLRGSLPNHNCFRVGSLQLWGCEWNQLSSLEAGEESFPISWRKEGIKRLLLQHSPGRVEPTLTVVDLNTWTVLLLVMRTHINCGKRRWETEIPKTRGAGGLGVAQDVQSLLNEDSRSDCTQIWGIDFSFRSHVRRLVTHLSRMKFSQRVAVTCLSSSFSVGKVSFTFNWPSIPDSYHRLFN